MNKMTITTPISTTKGMISFFIGFFFTILQTKRKLRDMPMEYAPSSNIPKGDARKMKSGGMFDKDASEDAIALNAAPVCHPVKDPQQTPKAGINMGNATDVLCKNIPKASIPFVAPSKSLRKDCDSSLDILYPVPIV